MSKASTLFNTKATSASGGGKSGIMTVDSDKGLLVNSLNAKVVYSDKSSGSNMICPVGGWYSEKGASQFTVTSSFSLSQVDLCFNSQNSSNTATVKISIFTSNASGPTGSVLGISNTISLPSGYTSAAVYSFMFASPISLTTQQYVAVIEFVNGDAYNDYITIFGGNYNNIDNFFNIQYGSWVAAGNTTAYLMGYESVDGKLEIKLKTNSGLNIGPSGLALNSVTGPMGATGFRGYTGIQGVTGASGVGSMNPIVAALVFG